MRPERDGNDQQRMASPDHATWGVIGGKFLEHSSYTGSGPLAHLLLKHHCRNLGRVDCKSDSNHDPFQGFS